MKAPKQSDTNKPNQNRVNNTNSRRLSKIGHSTDNSTRECSCISSFLSFYKNTKLGTVPWGGKKITSAITSMHADKDIAQLEEGEEVDAKSLSRTFISSLPWCRFIPVLVPTLICLIVLGTQQDESIWAKRSLRDEDALSPHDLSRAVINGRHKHTSVSLSSIQQLLVRPEEIRNGLQRIYYINLEISPKRRAFMEGWLSRHQRATVDESAGELAVSVPYERINATVGISDVKQCWGQASKQPWICRGVSGLVMTELDVIRNHNTTGLTMVLEDDCMFRPKYSQTLDKLIEATLAMVPDDWDVIRWDCWGKIPDSFDVIDITSIPKVREYLPPINQSVAHDDQNYLPRPEEIKVFRTMHMRQETHWFCGGTHAMLWRGSSVHKLDTLWSPPPYINVDCLLVTAAVKSYCVNFGATELVQLDGEETTKKKPGKGNR